MKNNKVIFSTLILCLCLALAWLGASYYRMMVHQPVDHNSTKKVEFIIQKGEKGSSVGQKLVDLNLIRSSLFFRIFLRLQQTAGKPIQAGEYKLSRAMSLAQIVEEIQHGTFEIKLTFPEGLRIEEIASKLSTYQAIELNEENFLNTAKTNNFDHDFLSNISQNATLEGFLFPDTYFITPETSANELIKMMLNNFDKKFDQKLREDLQIQNLSIFEAVTFASIVEREAKFEKDRPIVAGILIKRYKHNWPLEADATVQYAVANLESLLNPKLKTQNSKLIWWKEKLTKEDLEIESLYNTRRYPGLPPGPICNPGLSSIKAVVYPEESEYWYYVSDSDGNIYYSKTYDEHLQKVAQLAQ